MPRAKRGNKRLEKRKKILALAKGYYGRKSKTYRSAKESVERVIKFRLYGKKVEKARFSSAVDCPHQRGLPFERDEIFALYARFENRRNRIGPKSSRRFSRQTAGSICDFSRTSEERDQRQTAAGKLV